MSSLSSTMTPKNLAQVFRSITVESKKIWIFIQFFYFRCIAKNHKISFLQVH